MTCVVGWITKGRTYIGADSQGSNWETKVVRTDSKVWMKHDMLWGVCGSYRLINILKHDFKVPTRESTQPLDEYMCSTFLTALRTALKDGGIMRVEYGVERMPGEFMVAVEDQIFLCGSDLQMAEHVEPYVTTGSGDVSARSVCWALEQTNPRMKVEKKIELALSAAGHVLTSVGGPHLILSIPHKKPDKK